MPARERFCLFAALSGMIDHVRSIQDFLGVGCRSGNVGGGGWEAHLLEGDPLREGQWRQRAL
jgi:hypothetical protein